MSAVKSIIRTSDIQIYDPVLLFSSNQNQMVFSKSQEAFIKFHNECTQKYNEVQASHLKVRKSGSELQNRRIIIPSQTELENQRTSFIKEHTVVKKTAETMLFQMQHFISNLKSASSLFSEQKHSYTEEQRLEQEQPEFSAQLRQYNELTRKALDKFKENISKLSQLQNDFKTLIDVDYPKYLQRFCVIVENKGEPLTLMKRALGYVTQPVVPKPELKVEVVIKQAPESPSNQTEENFAEPEVFFAEPVTDSSEEENKQASQNLEVNRTLGLLIDEKGLNSPSQSQISNGVTEFQGLNLIIEQNTSNNLGLNGTEPIDDEKKDCSSVLNGTEGEQESQQEESTQQSEYIETSSEESENSQCSDDLEDESLRAPSVNQTKGQYWYGNVISFTKKLLRLE